MTDCIFCKLVAGEIPSAKVYEDKKTLGFLDINPVNKGHVLVIPKEHYHWMQDTPDELISEVFVVAKKMMIKIKDALQADYVSSVVVGTDVPHFHVHLIPRYYEDGMRKFWPAKKYEEGEMEEMAKRLALSG